MKKTYKFITFLLLAIMFLSLSVYAQSSKEISDEIFENYKEEYQKLNADISPKTELDFSNSVPVYIYDYWKENEPKSFIDRFLIRYNIETEGERWKEEYSTSTGGKWVEASLSTIPVYPDKDGKEIDIRFTMDWFIQKATEVFDGEIDDIKVAYYNYIYFVYFTSEEVEYVVPFSSRPDFSNLENGKLYEADDAMKIMEDSKEVKIIPYGEDPTAYAGGPVMVAQNPTDEIENIQTQSVEINAQPQTQELPQNNYTLWIIVIVSVLIVSALGFIVLRKRK